jgi:hypothetical protein
MPSPNPDLKGRARQAIKHFKKIERIWLQMDKVPSFDGKSAFMDKVLKAYNSAHLLAFDLGVDAGLPERELLFQSKPSENRKRPG